jgi:hypothetical protein
MRAAGIAAGLGFAWIVWMVVTGPVIRYDRRSDGYDVVRYQCFALLTDPGGELLTGLDEGGEDLRDSCARKRDRRLAIVAVASPVVSVLACAAVLGSGRSPESAFRRYLVTQQGPAARKAWPPRAWPSKRDRPEIS